MLYDSQQVVKRFLRAFPSHLARKQRIRGLPLDSISLSISDCHAMGEHTGYLVLDNHVTAEMPAN
jgi:hypothetical protein